MSRTTRLVLGGAALVLLIGAMWFGTLRHQMPRSDCGSVFDARKGADHDCEANLRSREAIFWVVFTTGAGLGLAAAAGGRWNR